MSDPKGINYPDDPELRKHLASVIQKIQDHPDRKEVVARSEQWNEYVASVVQRLQTKKV